jgi:hypothetical protein
MEWRHEVKPPSHNSVGISGTASNATTIVALDVVTTKMLPVKQKLGIQTLLFHAGVQPFYLGTDPLPGISRK